MVLFHGRLPRLLFKPHVCINSEVVCGTHSWIPVNLLIESSQQKKAVETGQFGWVAPFQHHFKVVKDHFLFVFETLCLYFVRCHVFGFSFGEKWNTLTSSIHYLFRWRVNSAGWFWGSRVLEWPGRTRDFFCWLIGAKEVLEFLWLVNMECHFLDNITITI